VHCDGGKVRVEDVNDFSAWVIGLGSNHGDDQAGWKVIDRLRATQTTGVHTLAAADPLAIADVPACCALLIVVDACRGAGMPGSVHRFVWPDSRLAEAGGVSSHGLGLVAALQLAETLGRLPPQVVVFTIEAESAARGAVLHPLVEAAIPEVGALVLAEIATHTRRKE
jgi:hydrogenase maturation protease